MRRAHLIDDAVPSPRRRRTQWLWGNQVPQQSARGARARDARLLTAPHARQMAQHPSRITGTHVGAAQNMTATVGMGYARWVRNHTSGAMRWEPYVRGYASGTIRQGLTSGAVPLLVRG